LKEETEIRENRSMMKYSLLWLKAFADLLGADVAKYEETVFDFLSGKPLPDWVSITIGELGDRGNSMGTSA
jgi:hypothetical protein